jgi:hypothetical protein
MNAYKRNIARVLAGKTKRPPTTQDGREQSKGNRQYRYVHLVMAAAVKNGWAIEHYPLENCDQLALASTERQRILELECNMNAGPSWDIENFEKLAKELT